MQNKVFPFPYIQAKLIGCVTLVTSSDEYIS
ncbi:MAG: hypothetical protein ACI9CZ_001289 [Flavobacterium sp.]|jgi:hypothetical protein